MRRRSNPVSQPPAYRSPAPLLSVTRPHTTTADRTNSIPRPATQPSWSLSQMRRDNGHHPDSHCRSDPAPFSAFVPHCRMKPIFKIRQSRSIFRFDLPSCTLPPKKVLVPAPESLPTAIIFYVHHRVPAILLFSHQAHPSIAYLMPPIDAIENP